MAARIYLTPAEGRLFDVAPIKGTPKVRAKKRRDELPENIVATLCRDWLVKVKGWRAFRQTVGRFKRLGGAPQIFAIGEPGLPDWRFERRGVVMHIEIKAPGNKPSPDQVAWIRHYNELGGVAVWFDSLAGLQDWYRAKGWT